MTSHKFETDPDILISRLSFSHIREIMKIDDPFERFFYEFECMKGIWSVQELRRQIGTNLYFRAGVSKKPELLLEKIQCFLQTFDYLDIDYEIDNTLVRGLDYYDYMVYELKADDGLSVAGGGRYNHMVKELDGPETSCVGFAAGVERVMNLLREKYTDDDALDVYVMAVVI